MCEINGEHETFLTIPVIALTYMAKNVQVIFKRPLIHNSSVHLISSMKGGPHYNLLGERAVLSNQLDLM